MNIEKYCAGPGPGPEKTRVQLYIYIWAWIIKQLSYLIPSTGPLSVCRLRRELKEASSGGLHKDGDDVCLQ